MQRWRAILDSDVGCQSEMSEGQGVGILVFFLQWPILLHIRPGNVCVCVCLCVWIQGRKIKNYITDMAESFRNMAAASLLCFVIVSFCVGFVRQVLRSVLKSPLYRI
jgi:bacterioferritin-associated ferredoxin